LLFVALFACAYAGTLTSLSQSLSSIYANKRATSGTVLFTTSSAGTATTFTITAVGGYDIGGCAAAAVPTGTSVTAGTCTATSTVLTCTGASLPASTAVTVTFTACINTPTTGAVAATASIWTVQTGQDAALATAAGTAITANTVDNIVFNSTSAGAYVTGVFTFLLSGSAPAAAIFTITLPTGWTASVLTNVVLSGTSSSSTAVTSTATNTISLTLTGLATTLTTTQTLVATIPRILATSTVGNVTIAATSGTSLVVESFYKTISTSSAHSAVASLMAVLLALFVALAL